MKDAAAKSVINRVLMQKVVKQDERLESYECFEFFLEDNFDSWMGRLLLV